jgi:hypothetical protein
LKLYGYLERLNTRTLYCDTDSVIYSCKKGEWEPECGDYLGDMSDELSDKIGLNTITTFIGAGLLLVIISKYSDGSVMYVDCVKLDRCPNFPQKLKYTKNTLVFYTVKMKIFIY